MKLRGFTLIELLVVIAIIGILASVVLAQVNSARDNGVDAAIKINFGSINSEAEIAIADTGDYSTVCGLTDIQAALENSSQKSTGAVDNYECYDEPTAWAASVPLMVQNQVGAASGVDHYCIDRSGQGVVIDDALGTDVTVCP